MRIFFKALRARIARGPEFSPSRRTDESWAAALLVTARQLLPAMAVLLLLMVGATLFWRQPPTLETSQAAVRPRERVVFSDMYDLSRADARRRARDIGSDRGEVMESKSNSQSKARVIVVVSIRDRVSRRERSR